MITPARPELIALAAATRGDDWAADLDRALTQASVNGWEWDRQGRFACRLIFTEDATPRELAEAVRSPLQPGQWTPPTDAWREARAALDARQGGAA